MKLLKNLLNFFRRAPAEGVAKIDTFELRDRILKQARVSATPCSPGNQQGDHGKLISGLGAMGDAIICTRCGRDKYSEHWKAEEVARAEPCTLENMPEVLQARALVVAIEANNLDWLK